MEGAVEAPSLDSPSSSVLLPLSSSPHIMAIKKRLKPIAARIITDLLLIIITVCIYNTHKDANSRVANTSLLPSPSYTIQVIIILFVNRER